MTIMETRPQYKLTPCPSWCFEEHLPPAIDDGTHCSEPLAVSASRHPRRGMGDCEEILVNVHQEPGKPPLIHLGHHDGMLAGEDVLTAAEAEQVAHHLQDLASIIRANGDHTCWCDGLHTPGDQHAGEMRNVRTRAHGPHEISISIVRHWDETDALVEIVSHNGNDLDELTPNEADQLAARLRDCIAIIRNTEGAR